MSASRSAGQAVFSSLRPRQWSKNLLLFAGILFAAKLGDVHRWGEAVVIFVAYCAASSAAYLVNDVRDAPADRLHPVKRHRAIARGEVPPERALAFAGLLGALAIGLAAALGVTSLLFLLAFGVLQLAYSLGLKHVVFVDVATIAALFVVRAAAGARAVNVRISPWLLACTALLALFLGLAKRRGELVLVHADATPGRRVLDHYSLVLVDRLLAIVTTATVAAYAIYTVTTHTAWLALTIPFVVLGLVRYLVLVHRHELGEEPENVLLKDRPVLACIALWAIAAAAILATSN
ncbi:MAG: UbiA family prenyltransferase [Gaiellaceae bacterium]